MRWDGWVDASETVTTTRAHAVLIYLGLSLKDCYIFCLIWYICMSKQEVLSMYGGLLERGSSVVQIIAPVTTGKYIHYSFCFGHCFNKLRMLKDIASN